MARKVVVVLSQAPRRNAQRQALEEELVAALLMEDGREVNVIPHVANLDEDETGKLCLEGIPGDMLLVCWLPSDESHQRLAELGIHGRLGRTSQGTLEAAADNGRSGRTIYCLDLNRYSSAATVRAEVNTICSAASVQTFDIVGMLAGPTPPAPAEAAAETTAAETTDPARADQSSAGEGDESGGAASATGAALTTAVPPASDAASEREPQTHSKGADHPAPPSESSKPQQPLDPDQQMDAELDGLVDQLDDMEW